MAIERTVRIQLDGTQAINDLKQVRSEIDVTYAELRKTTQVEIDGTKAKTELNSIKDTAKQSADDTKKIGTNAEGSADGFKILGVSVNTVGTAIKGLGIGLLIGAFVKLQDAISQNQKALDFINTISLTLSKTFQDLVGFAVSAFEDPLGALKDFGNTLLQFALNPINKILDSFSLFGQAVKSAFKGDFKEAADLAIQSGQSMFSALNPVGMVIDAITNSTSDAIKENNAYAKSIVDLRNEVKLADAEQRRLQLTFQKDAEIQRQIRDNTNLTIDERIAANRRLGEILEEQFQSEKVLAQQRIDLAQREFDANDTNVDLQVALTNAKTELADLEERITGQRSEQLINLTALENEYTDSIKEEPIVVQAVQEELETTNADIIRDKQDTADEEIQISADKIAMLKQMEISGAQSILSSLGQLAGEGTQMAKATALAQILINTAQSISGAIAAGAGVPFPGNLGAIATGVGAVLSGIASAKSIFKKVKAPGPGDVDTPRNVETAVAEQGVGPLAPNIEAVEQQQLGAPSPVQAFVVENEISNAQALQEELDLQATL